MKKSKNKWLKKLAYVFIVLSIFEEISVMEFCQKWSEQQLKNNFSCKHDHRTVYQKKIDPRIFNQIALFPPADRRDCIFYQPYLLKFPTIKLFPDTTEIPLGFSLFQYATTNVS